MKIEAPTTITIDGKLHEVSSFSEKVQQLVDIHTAWREDLIRERLAVSKTEAAIRAADAELAQQVQLELKAAQESTVSE